MSVALVIQHALRVRRIILWSVASLTVPYFSTLSYKERDFLEKVIECKCVFWSLKLVSETFPIIRRIKRDVVIEVQMS